MPNWCYTDFTVSGPTEDITRFREAVRGTEDGVATPFDFNRLIPMPFELLETIDDFGTAYNVYYGEAEPILEYAWVKNLGIKTVEQLRERFNADPQRRATADAWKTNVEKYGAPTWCEWRCEHWDTKWNACGAKVTDIGDGSLHVQFDTAWSFPFPIFETVVSAFPQLLFEGSAYEPNFDFYIKFEGRNGEYDFEDDDQARKAAAAEYEEEDEKVTA